MRMLIESHACLGSFGRDAAALLNAFAHGAKNAWAEKADTSGLAEFYPARALRQCDHFSRMALLAAGRAFAASGMPGAEKEGPAKGLAGSPAGDMGGNLGIVLASGYGPAMPTFDFLDSILDHGEALASPLAFSLSVHNIPAAIVAKTMGISGPCATVCQFESSVASGLMLAQGWLEEGRVTKVLFGAVDEVTATLQGICAAIAAGRGADAPAPRGKLPLGEAAVFFLLSGGDEAASGARGAARGEAGTGIIDAVSLSCVFGTDDETLPADLRFMSGAFSPAERAALGALDGSAAYGNLPVAQALDLVLALELLRRDHLKTAVCLNRGSGAGSAVRLARAGAAL